MFGKPKTKQKRSSLKSAPFHLETCMAEAVKGLNNSTPTHDARHPQDPPLPSLPDSFRFSANTTRMLDRLCKDEKHTAVLLFTLDFSVSIKLILTFYNVYMFHHIYIHNPHHSPLMCTDMLWHTIIQVGLISSRHNLLSVLSSNPSPTHETAMKQSHSKFPRTRMPLWCMAVLA